MRPGTALLLIDVQHDFVRGSCTFGSLTWQWLFVARLLSSHACASS